MARKDTILRSFLEHDLIRNKYEVEVHKIPNTVREALTSDVPIIKAIALIVEKLETSKSTTDKALQDVITKYLNGAIT